MPNYNISNEDYIFSRISDTYAYKNYEIIKHRVSKFIEYLKILPHQKLITKEPLTYSATTTIKTNGYTYIFSLQYKIDGLNIIITHVSFYKT